MSMVVLHIATISAILTFALYHALRALANAYTSVLYKTSSALVACAVVYLAVRRDTYLPFLGETALPGSALMPMAYKKAGDFAIRIEVDAPDESRVVYWASKPSAAIFENPRLAYTDSDNVGVSHVKNKSTTFFVAYPSAYKVPMKTLRPHIHYRIIMPHGLLSQVKTVYV